MQEATDHVATDPFPHHMVAERARALRLLILDMVSAANSSHIGTCYSMVDILSVIYSVHLDIDLIREQRYPRDYFILSKGHGAAGLYAALASVGLIPYEDLKTYYGDNSRLGGHPVRNKYPGIEASTGSLGHGGSLAVGIALGLKHDGHPHKVFTLLGDGECQEGSVWEAIDSAVRFQLTHLTIIIDRNNLQGLGRTDEVSPTPLGNKFRGFGCNVIEIDGHDLQAINDALVQPLLLPAPRVIIAHTVKGKGVSYMEDKLEWHYRAPRGELYDSAKKELESR